MAVKLFHWVTAGLWTGEMASLFSNETTRLPVCAVSTQLHSGTGTATRQVFMIYFRERNMSCKALFSLKSKKNGLPPFSFQHPIYYKYDNYIPATDYIHHEF